MMQKNFKNVDYALTLHNGFWKIAGTLLSVKK